MQSVFVPLALTLVRSPLYVGPASQQLRQHGFTVLEKERLDPLLVEQCRSWCGTRLLEVLEHKAQRVCLPSAPWLSLSLHMCLHWPVPAAFAARLAAYTVGSARPSLPR